MNGDLPQGLRQVCFDTTVLIAYNDEDELTVLNQLFPEGKFIPNVIPDFELQRGLGAHPQNQRIIDATWLTSVPVGWPDGVKRVLGLLSLWKSPADQDHGEAEVIALCERYEWLAIMDDHQGRNTARALGIKTSYMSTMIAAAGAIGVAGYDADSAWELHQRVESKRDRPRLQDEERFKALVRAFNRIWEKQGQPSLPEFLAEPGLDGLVDRLDPLI
jgi:predicted nucleic acid-binding protein